jgi:hypothetical protein
VVAVARLLGADPGGSRGTAAALVDADHAGGQLSRDVVRSF